MVECQLVLFKCSVATGFNRSFPSTNCPVSLVAQRLAGMTITKKHMPEWLMIHYSYNGFKLWHEEYSWNLGVVLWHQTLNEPQAKCCPSLKHMILRSLGHRSNGNSCLVYKLSWLYIWNMFFMVPRIHVDGKKFSLIWNEVWNEAMFRPVRWLLVVCIDRCLYTSNFFNEITNIYPISVTNACNWQVKT